MCCWSHTALHYRDSYRKSFIKPSYDAQADLIPNEGHRDNREP
jgi:hypothetical protein